MDICVWDKCNNRCKMCSNPDLPWSSLKKGSVNQEPYNYDEIISRLEDRKRDGKMTDYILMTGGEPTLHPRFLDILKYLTKNFSKQKVGILSNGRLFSYKSFAREVLKINNLFLGVSVYGHNAETHDAITQSKGSFVQTISGLKNILAYRNPGHLIEVRTVISGLSYPHLDKMIEFISVEFPSVDRFVLIFLEFEGQAVKNLKETKVNYAQVVPKLKKALPLFKKFKEIQLYHFPLCAIDSVFWPYIRRALPEYEITFLPVCQKCDYREYCLGIHKGHIKYIGTKEFKPIKREINIVPNQEDFKHHPIRKVSF